MLRVTLPLLALALMAQAAPPAAPAAPAEVALWRLDCGGMDVADFGAFSDTHRYDGRPKKMVVSCYLIRHGSDYMIWDTGFAPGGSGPPNKGPGLTAQLQQLGITPAQVRYVGVSHYHGDHAGGAAAFPGATLLIGTGDWEAMKAPPPGADTSGLKPWLDGQAKAEPVPGDKDVFGDGSVTMLDMPGHTPGHHSLLVRLKAKGWVLLSGDLYHAAESYTYSQVPVFNVDRAKTLASMDRFKGIAANLKATVIVQHEPEDVAKLPAFPEPAR